MSVSDPPPPSLQRVRNIVFSDLAVGQTAGIVRTLTRQDLTLLATISGDIDGAHANLHGLFAHGMWGGGLVAAVLGTRLPGPGAMLHSQALRFLAPVDVGDTLDLRVTVTALEPVSRQVTLACKGTNQAGAVVIEGTAIVVADAGRVEQLRTDLPDIGLDIAGAAGRQGLLDHVRRLEAVRVGVVHPCDAASLAAALEAKELGLIVPVLVGPCARLAAAAEQAGLELSDIEIVDAPHSHAAAEQAAALAGRGELEALMKGSLHTDELMAAVLSSSAALRTERRVSHCFVLQTPHYPRPFIVTDAAVNIAPDLEQKADIVRNAIALAHVLGVAEPRVAVLAAVETVSPAMPATLDAAALCKMAERGQISGGILDGPLAFDNAVSVAAARTKGIESPVAGQADILVVPDLESGNMLAKQLMYMGDAASAGIVMGAKVPIILTSRADTREARIASCAVALVLAHHYRGSPP